MIVSELMTYRMPEDPASPVPAGDMWWSVWCSMREGLVCHRTNFSVLCSSIMTWSCTT
jgi:hypothetical protein